MQDYFYTLADTLTSLLRGREVYTCMFHGEASDFVRFNRSAIRQPGTITQHTLRLDLIDGRRHTASHLALSGDLEIDRARLTSLVEGLRDKLPHLPEDPHLLYATEVRSSEHHGENRLPQSEDPVAALLEAGRDRDLVGIYAAGGIHTGFANAFGQRNWFSSYSFNADWSFYHAGDKAVKTAYAGFVWNQRCLCPESDGGCGPTRTAPSSTPDDSARALSRLSGASSAPRRARNPRVGWLWSERSPHKTDDATAMHEEGAQLHPAVTIIENTRDGVAPNFQEDGFIKPDQVHLIDIWQLP